MNSSEFKELKTWSVIFSRNMMEDYRQNRKTVHERIEAEKADWALTKRLNNELINSYGKENLTLDRHKGLYHVK